jgi:hypothetical protein
MVRTVGNAPQTVVRVPPVVCVGQQAVSEEKELYQTLNE